MILQKKKTVTSILNGCARHRSGHAKSKRRTLVAARGRVFAAISASTPRAKETRQVGLEDVRFARASIHIASCTSSRRDQDHLSTSTLAILAQIRAIQNRCHTYAITHA